MTVGEALRYLRSHGILLSPAKGSHHWAKNPANGKKAIFPVHSQKKEIPPGTWNKILKDLGLK